MSKGYFSYNTKLLTIADNIFKCTMLFSYIYWIRIKIIACVQISSFLSLHDFSSKCLIYWIVDKYLDEISWDNRTELCTCDIQLLEFPLSKLKHDFWQFLHRCWSVLRQNYLMWSANPCSCKVQFLKLLNSIT